MTCVWITDKPVVSSCTVPATRPAWIPLKGTARLEGIFIYQGEGQIWTAITTGKLFYECTWQLVAFLAHLGYWDFLSRIKASLPLLLLSLTKSSNKLSFHVLIWCDIDDYCLIIYVKKVVAITFPWWCCSEFMMKWDMGKMWDVSVLMEIYSVVTFDQIYLVKS